MYYMSIACVCNALICLLLARGLVLQNLWHVSQTPLLLWPSSLASYKQKLGGKQVHREVTVMLCATCFFSFCRTMLCKHGLCRHAVSVCVSVTLVHSVKTNKHIFEIFLLPCSQAILVFPYQTAWQYSDKNPRNGGVDCGWGRQKSRFWAYICLLFTLQQADVVNTVAGAPRPQSSRLWHSHRW